MASLILVTAADAGFYGLLQGLVLSVRRAVPEVELAFLDIGLRPDQLAWVRAQGVRVAPAGWDRVLPDRDRIADRHKAYNSRPYLREIFPGHELYGWMDADTWVQDRSAIDLFVRGARSRGAALVPELDRGSRIQYGGLRKYWEWARSKYEKSVGAAAARELCTYPMLNAGVFVFRHDAPHWAAWSARLRAVPDPTVHMADQATLNAAVYLDGLFDRTEMLPAWCNWTCHFGLPTWDPDRQRLVEPYLPHTPIGVLHLTNRKFALASLRTTRGETANVVMRYPGGEVPEGTPVVGESLSDWIARFVSDNAPLYAAGRALVFGSGLAGCAIALAAAGCRTDYADSRLTDPAWQQAVLADFDRVAPRDRIAMIPSDAPEALIEVAKQYSREWSVIVVGRDRLLPTISAAGGAIAVNAAVLALGTVTGTTAAWLRQTGWTLATDPTDPTLGIAWRGRPPR